METFEVIENVQSFLDLAIESREVISSLEALNLSVELSLGLDSDLSDREGGSSSVSCTLDEDTEFTVFHPTADTWEWVDVIVDVEKKMVIGDANRLSFPNLVLIADLREKPH